MKIHYTILFCLLLFKPMINLGQTFDCASDFVQNYAYRNDSIYRNKYLAFLSEFNERRNHQSGSRFLATTYTVPVVVHVIHLGEPIGTGSNISDEQIIGAIDSLNKRFRNSIGSGVNTDIQFCLANQDTLGNPTSGITRTDGSAIFGYQAVGVDVYGTCNGADEYALKNMTGWDRSKYYNIWVVTRICGGWGGWAYAPNGSVLDGTLIIYSRMSGASPTLTHELGHGFNLLHTFNGDGGNTSCPQNSNCTTQGDQVCDTPPHKQSDCGALNPCTSVGVWNNSKNNYMSYCYTLDLFTSGQKDIMILAANIPPRLSLLSSKGCNVENNTLVIPNVFTPNNDGLNDLLKPMSDKSESINKTFIYNRWGTLVCTNTSKDILWDGKIEGDNAPEGLYYWVLDLKKTDGTSERKCGFVQLLR